MNVGAAIRGILIAANPVTAIVGTAGNARIFPLYAPQTVAMPCVTYQQISNTPNATKSSTSTLDEYRFQVNCIAETHDAAIDLGVKVRAALDYASGTYNSITVQHIKYEGENTTWTDTEKLQGACMLSQDYLVRTVRTP